MYVLIDLIIVIRFRMKQKNFIMFVIVIL